jgi:hypothetical protein
LAITAPEALAELAWRALVPAPVKHRDRFFPPERREPFTYVDHDLLNVSPAQGPFLNLLEHAPHMGLGLVGRLVAHLVEFHRQTGQADGEPIVIPAPFGAVRFTYPWTYAWSRDANGHYRVTCALMALEAWAHRRIEVGELIDGVVADIIGESDCAAVILLVVVDVLISHWPKTRRFAIPFLGVPELLVLDHERQNIDRMRDSGAFDFSLFGEKEPQGLATLESLRRCAFRVAPLGNLLTYCALSEPLAERDQILQALRAACERLGQPGPTRILSIRPLWRGIPSTCWTRQIIEQSKFRKRTGRKLMELPTLRQPRSTIISHPVSRVRKSACKRSCSATSLPRPWSIRANLQLC